LRDGANIGAIFSAPVPEQHRRTARAPQLRSTERSDRVARFGALSP
jgi:hypothetical protein